MTWTARSRSWFEDGTICPVCGTWWGLTLKRPGNRCNDQSQRQARRCVGRLIPADQFERAEWRTGAFPERFVRNSVTQ
jgi:hypothetical protein